MVLMAAGDQLDPGYDALAHVIALPHVLWDTWIPARSSASMSFRQMARLFFPEHHPPGHVRPCRAVRRHDCFTVGIKRSRYAEVVLQSSSSLRHGLRRLHPQVFVRQCRVFKRHENVSGDLERMMKELTASAASAMKIKVVTPPDDIVLTVDAKTLPLCEVSAPSLCRQTLATFPLHSDAVSSVSGSVIPATIYDLSDGNIVFEHVTKEPTASAPSAMKIKRVAPTENIIHTVGAKRSRVWLRFGGKGGLAVSWETAGLCPSLSLNAWRDPILRRSRISQASQLLTSIANQPLARWSSSIVERYVGDAILNTLSSHVRRARSFQSAVHCPASSLAAPIGADQNPSYTDFDEEAGAAASVDHIIARLQSLEAADQVRNASDLLVVVNLHCGVVHRGVGDPSNPTDWQARCGFHFGGLEPHVRFADSRESLVDCGICLCRSSHARPILCPILCWSIWRQFHWCSLHRSSHILGLKQERGL